jgi:hypothetical protein
MDAVCSSEMLARIYQTIGLHIPKIHSTSKIIPFPNYFSAVIAANYTVINDVCS